MATISDEEAQKLVVGVLHEVGWHRQDIIALLKGPLFFYAHLRQGAPPDAPTMHSVRHYNHDRIMRDRLHQGTEPAGHTGAYGNAAEVHALGLGTITEKAGKEG